MDVHCMASFAAVCLRRGNPGGNMQTQNVMQNQQQNLKMNVQPVPALDAEINDIRMRTAAIINEHVLPNEGKLWGWLADSANATNEVKAEARQLREDIQAVVKNANLWAPHLPPEFGGMGLSFLQHAYMNEVLAYSPGAASLFGVVAPNSGNQKNSGEIRHAGTAREVAQTPHRRHHAIRILHDRAGQPRI